MFFLWLDIPATDCHLPWVRLLCLPTSFLHNILCFSSILLFLSLKFPFSRFLCKNSAFFKNMNTLQHLSTFFCAHFLQLAAVHQFWSHSLSCITRACSAPYQNFSLPMDSCHHVMSSHVPAHSIFPITLPSLFGPVQCPFIFMYLLLLATSHALIFANCGTPLCVVLRYLPFFSSTRIHFFLAEA